jgi:SNW domain-containing protein 1
MCLGSCSVPLITTFLCPLPAACPLLLPIPSCCRCCCPLQNLTRPDEEEIERTAKETLEALNKRVNSKLATQNPSTLPEQPGAPTYIKYTPSQQGAAYASGAKQRIIKMQDMPIDPLEPPKFRHTKVPRGTGSPPVPVMHSPPRPVTAEDHANWKIPPCISNWKNAKGYTIPLDKRLAADGRGLQVRLTGG